MHKLNEMLKKRRSIRSYTSHPVPKELVDSMLEALLLSPTSKGIASRSTVVVDDREKISRLAACKAHGSSFLETAPLAIVIAADTGKAAAWIEDCSIAAITLQYAAEELGLGSCWIQVRERQSPDGGPASAYIRRELDLPEHVEVEAVVAVGYPAETLPPRSPDSLDRASVRYNGYGRAYF
jgi:nitroreductase